MDACFSYNCKFGIASVLTEKINILKPAERCQWYYNQNICSTVLPWKKCPQITNAGMLEI